jgi:hypothetical protein
VVVAALVEVHAALVGCGENRLRIVAKEQLAISHAVQSPEDDDPILGEAPDIEVVTAIDAGDERGRRHPASREAVDARVHEAHGEEPPGHVPAAIAARHPAMRTEAEIDRAAALQELFGDLATRRPAADDEHGAGGQLVGIEITARVELKGSGWEGARQRRHRGLLKGSRCHHHARCFDRRAVRLDQEASRSRVLAKRRHLDAATDRSSDEPCVVLDEASDLGMMGERIGVVARVGEARQPQGPVGELEIERVPPFAVPALRHPLALEDDVVQPALAQVTAHGQAGLAPADDDGVVPFPHATSPNRSTLLVARRRSSTAQDALPAFYAKAAVRQSVEFAGEPAGGSGLSPWRSGSRPGGGAGCRSARPPSCGSRTRFHPQSSPLPTLLGL